MRVIHTLVILTILLLGASISARAQTPTVQLRAMWDQVIPDPTVLGAQAIAGYQFTFDNQAPVTVPDQPDPTCTCISVVFSASGGTHTISVVTQDVLGQLSVPTSLTFTLQGGPAGVKNLRVGK